MTHNKGAVEKAIEFIDILEQKYSEGFAEVPNDPQYQELKDGLMQYGRDNFATIRQSLREYQSKQAPEPVNIQQIKTAAIEEFWKDCAVPKKKLLSIPEAIEFTIDHLTTHYTLHPNAERKMR